MGISNQDIKITIPKKHQSRIGYVVEYLFKTCLGVSYQLDFGDVDNQVLVHVNGKELVFPCDFESLNESIRPSEKMISANDATFNVVSLFNQYHSKKYSLEVDIFSATFWFLTRLEEYNTTELDEHQRYDCTKSSLDLQFAQRPLIQEYAEVLFAFLKKADPTITRKIQPLRKIMSHDIDRLYKWKKGKTLGGEFLRIMTGNSIWTAKGATASYYKTKLGKELDPFDNLKLISDIYQEQGWETIMYFGTHVNNKKYDHFDYKITDTHVKSRIKELKNKGVTIGLHPSYDSYNSYDLLVDEKDRLEQVLGEQIVHSRQHYLRFKNPETFRILNDAGIQFDSTLGYYDRAGFRCGTSIPFHTYDLERSEKLDLKEIPLLCMDTHNPNMDKDIENTIEVVKKYGGTVMVLVHNSSDYLLNKIGSNE